MDSKLNELLSEIAHETAQGILAADEKSARAALEKIHASIESVLPVDGCTVTGAAKDEGTPVYRTPQHIIDFIYRVAKVPFADKADPELLDRIAWTHRLVPLKSGQKLKSDKRVAKTPQTIVFETTLQHGRKLSAQWSAKSTESNATAKLWDGDKHVAEITFFTNYQGMSWGRKITQHALKGLASRAGHKSRIRAKKREVA